MKNKFTHFLMAGALVCWSSYTLHAQTEVTDTYLKNPSFESNFTDWDNAGLQTQTNTSFSKKDGNTYVEQWVGQGNKVADAHVSQTLTSLKKFKTKNAAQLHIPYVLHTGDFKEEDGIVFLPLYMTPLL